MTQEIQVDPAADEATIRELRQTLLDKKQLEVTATEAAWHSHKPQPLCLSALFALCLRHPSRLLAPPERGLVFHFESLEWTRPALHRPIGTLDKVLALLMLVVGPPFLIMMAWQVLGLAEVAGPLLSIPLYGVVFGLAAVGFAGVVVLQMFPLLGLALFLLGILIPALPWISGEAHLTLQAVVLSLVFGLITGVLCMVPGWKMLLTTREMYKRLLGDSPPAAWFGQGLRGLLRGPPRPSAWEESRRAVARIVDLGGTFTDGDLQELQGGALDKAASEAARIVCEAKGQLVLDDQKGLSYRVALKRPEGEIDVRPARVRDAAPPRLFGCSPSFVGLTLGYVGLALAGLILHPGLVLFPRPGHAALRRDLEGLGAWPYLPLLVAVLLRIVTWLWRRPRAS